VRTFYLRLVEEIQRAERSQRPLAILILQLPFRPTERWRQQQLEHRLRAGVRGNDFASHLSDTTFAVALPETGRGAAVVAARLERRLSEVANGRVIPGVAHWPRDGQTALELLRTAIRRSLVALPGRRMDPELQKLVGTLTP
jgi:GGDEF domain-containing protein